MHGAGIDEPLSMTRGANTYYYLTDGLGSIAQLVNSSGTVVKSYTYDSFGNILSETGTLANPFAFTARERDAESGLYFYRARSYDSTLGRFLQEDPKKGLLFLPQMINLYLYVDNNPINYTDPSGELMDPFSAAAFLLGATVGILILQTYLYWKYGDCGVRVPVFGGEPERAGEMEVPGEPMIEQ